MDERTLARFIGKIEVQPNGCWHWTAHINKSGYGYFYIDGKQDLAHRVAHTHFVAPIPAGHDVDHQCHNADTNCPGGMGDTHRRCVNPAHLEAVTRSTNLSRGRTVQHLIAPNIAKTCCPAGHPYDGANTYVQAKGSRTCRACSRERARRKREAIPPKPRARKTRCNKGHAYAEHGYTNDIGRQVCRICSAERLRESRARRKALEPPKEPAKTCKRGHEWTEANTYVRPSTGQRACRTCHNEDTLARYYAKKNAAE